MSESALSPAEIGHYDQESAEYREQVFNEWFDYFVALRGELGPYGAMHQLFDDVMEWEHADLAVFATFALHRLAEREEP